MSQTTLVATTGRATGSPLAAAFAPKATFRACSTARAWIPISVTVERRELRLALSGPAGVNTVLDLEVAGTSYPAVVKEMQRHPVRRTVNHIDFLQVNMNEEITVAVPLRLEGEAKAVAGRRRPRRPAVDSSRSPAPRTTCRTSSSSTSPTCSPTTSSASATPDAEGVTALGDPDMPVVTVLTSAPPSSESRAEAARQGEGEGAEGGEAAAATRRRGRRRRRLTGRTPGCSTLLVIGLGNPGKEYARTRHNVGAEVVELLAARRRALKPAKRDKALVAEVAHRRQAPALAFPTTYMNDSGSRCCALMRRYGIDDPTQLVVVHDELDLPPGTVRVKLGGGLAGNNGLRSMTQHLQTQDYLRVRIGIGKPPSKERGADHVLSRLPKAERELRHRGRGAPTPSR